jgi:hypothetical protein
MNTVPSRVVLKTFRGGIFGCDREGFSYSDDPYISNTMPGYEAEIEVKIELNTVIIVEDQNAGTNVPECDQSKWWRSPAK